MERELERGTARGFIVRGARRTDLHEVRKLWSALMELHGEIHDYYDVRAGGDRIWMDYVARCLRDEDARLLVAEREGRVIGFLLAHVVHRYAFYRLTRLGVISDIAVAEKERRRGVGRALVEEALAWFRAQGLDRATANMVPANAEALAFWRAMRFEVLAEYRMRRL